MAVLIQEQTDVCVADMVQSQRESWAFISPYLITPSLLELSPPLLGRERNSLPETGISTIIGGLSRIPGGNWCLELFCVIISLPPSNERRVWSSPGKCSAEARPASPLADLPWLIAETKDLGFILQLKFQGPPKEPQSLHVASCDKWLAAGRRRRGGLLTRKKVAAQGNGRRWDGVPEGVDVVVTFWQPRAHVCNLQNSLRWFLHVFFQKASLGNDAYVASFLSLIIACPVFSI